MANGQFYLQCRVCRNPLVFNQQLDNEGCVNSSLWFIRNDDLPDWIEDFVTKEAWQKGKLYCPKCNGRVGSFNFIKVLKCLECFRHDVPPIHLLKDRVDQKSVTPTPLPVPKVSTPSSRPFVDACEGKTWSLDLKTNRELFDQPLIVEDKSLDPDHDNGFDDTHSEHDSDQSDPNNHDTCPVDFINIMDDALEIDQRSSLIHENGNDEKILRQMSPPQERVISPDTGCCNNIASKERVVAPDTGGCKNRASEKRVVLPGSAQERVVSPDTGCFKISTIFAIKNSSTLETNCGIGVSDSDDNDNDLDIKLELKRCQASNHIPDHQHDIHEYYNEAVNGNPDLLSSCDDKFESCAVSGENANGILDFREVETSGQVVGLADYDEGFEWTENIASIVTNSEEMSGFEENDQDVCMDEQSDVVDNAEDDILDAIDLRILDNDIILQEMDLLNHSESDFSALENNSNQNGFYQVPNESDLIPGGAADVDSPLSLEFLGSNRKRGRKKKNGRVKRERRRDKKNRMDLTLENEIIFEPLMLDFPDEHTCAVCFDLYCEPHVIVPCDHMMCEACLRRLGQKNVYTTPCPMCRQLINGCNKNIDLIKTLTEIYPDQYRARKKEQRRYLSNKFSPLPHRQSALNHNAAEIRNRILGNRNMTPGQFIKMKLLLGALLLFFLMMPVVTLGKAVINSAAGLVRSLYRR